MSLIELEEAVVTHASCSFSHCISFPPKLLFRVSITREIHSDVFYFLIKLSSRQYSRISRRKNNLIPSWWIVVGLLFTLSVLKKKMKMEAIWLETHVQKSIKFSFPCKAIIKRPVVVIRSSPSLEFKTLVLITRRDTFLSISARRIRLFVTNLYPSWWLSLFLCTMLITYVIINFNFKPSSELQRRASGRLKFSRVVNLPLSTKSWLSTQVFHLPADAAQYSK